MLQHKRHRQMVGILLLMAVVTLSCQFGPGGANHPATPQTQAIGAEQAARPTAAQPADQAKQLPTGTAEPALPTVTPTTPPAQAVQALAPEKIDTSSITSGADGTAQFTDPASAVQLAVTLENSDTHQPVGKISLWFASRGPEVLVMAMDPAGDYVPQLQTFSSQAVQAGKLAGKLSLIPLLTATKTPQAWEAYLRSLPDLSAWLTGTQELCLPPDKLKDRLPFQTDGLLLGRPDDQTIADWVDQPYYMGVGSAGLLLSAFPYQAPAIPRWKISRVGANGPALAIPSGFCLWPLDRNNEQSIATWVNYGLQNKDVYPFIKLTAGDRVAYANYLEGSQPNLAGDFLISLDSRLSNGAQCDGYGLTSDYLQVWTSGWNPAWEIRQMCYIDGCKMLDTPITSTTAGLFFTKERTGWTLSTVWMNTPDLWKDVYQLSLKACPPLESASKSPSEVALTPMPTVTLPATLSCPGAPSQRVQVNGQAFVCTSGDKLLMRAEPNRNAQVVDSIPNGTKMTVVDGPVCAENWSFWKVQVSNGVQGWVSEGGDAKDPYFICPSP